MALPETNPVDPNHGGLRSREQFGRMALEVRRLLFSDFSSRREIAEAIGMLPGFREYLFDRVQGGSLKAGREPQEGAEFEQVVPGSPEWVLWRFGGRVVESCLLDYLRGQPWMR